MMQPFLLPWARVLILIWSITSTTWSHEAWPEVKPPLRRALEMRRTDRAEGVVEQDAHREPRRLRGLTDCPLAERGLIVF